VPLDDRRYDQSQYEPFWALSDIADLVGPPFGARHTVIDTGHHRLSEESAYVGE